MTAIETNYTSHSQHIIRKDTIQRAVEPYKILQNNAQNAGLQEAASMLDQIIYLKGKLTLTPLAPSDQKLLYKSIKSSNPYIFNAIMGVGEVLEKEQESLPLVESVASIQIVRNTQELSIPKIVSADDPIVRRRINDIYSLLGATNGQELATDDTKIKRKLYQTNVGIKLIEEVNQSRTDPTHKDVQLYARRIV